MTRNLGSVKLSQLNHGSHCLPFLVDSSGLMVLPDLRPVAVVRHCLASKWAGHLRLVED